MKIISISSAFLIGVLFVIPSAELVRAQDNPNSSVQKAVKDEFSDIPVMVSIAQCESSYRQYDVDGSALQGGYGWMVGIYQIDKHIHGARARKMGININTIEGNMAYARYLYNRDGTAPWLASKACWRKSQGSCAATRAATNRTRES